MSEYRGTPGPWTVHETEWEDGGASFDVMADDGAVVVALPPTEADARLIAAAHDLLAACEMLMGDVKGGILIQKTIDAARAAIAKATGPARVAVTDDDGEI